MLCIGIPLVLLLYSMSKHYNKIKTKYKSEETKSNDLYEDFCIGKIDFLKEIYAVGAIVSFIFEFLSYLIHIKFQGTNLIVTSKDISTTSFGSHGHS